MKNVAGKPTLFALRAILEGNAKDLKATGLTLRYRQIAKDRIKLTMSICDADGHVLADYDDVSFEIREFDTLNLVDFSRVFDFKLIA